MYKWNNNDIIKIHGYEGEVRNDYIILNKVDKDLCFVKHIRTGRISLAEYNKILEGVFVNKGAGYVKYGNPYFNLRYGVTVLFDRNGKEIIVDSNKLSLIQDTLWTIRKNEFDTEYVSGRIDGRLVRLTSILMGTRREAIDHLNNDIYDCRLENLRKASERLNDIDTNTTKIKKEILYANKNYNRDSGIIRNIQGVIKQTGYEGDIRDGFQILSKYDDTHYYVRINNGIALAKTNGTGDIWRVADKLGRITGKNPYLDLDNKTTIVFDIRGREILLDTTVHRKYTDSVLGLGGGNTVYAYKNGECRYVARELTECSKHDIAIYKNGDKTDLRIKNLLRVSKSEASKARFADTEHGISEWNGRFRVTINIEGKSRHYGIYGSLDEARKARGEAIKKYYGI